MNKKTIAGMVWSATPTPLTQDRSVDVPSVHRLVEHHVKMGVTGLKELLVQIKIFTTGTQSLNYPLTDTCRNQITEALSGTDGLGYRADFLEPAPTA